MTDSLRILSIGAHPADIFDQSGGVAYAEGFISMNAETHYHLPVSVYARKMARESDHERMKRYSYKISTDT